MASSYPPPQLGVPVKRSRGPVVLFLVLVVVLIASVAGIVVIVLKGPNDPSEPKHAAAGTLEFRRVAKVEPNACAKAPVTANVRCSTDGTRYTLGKVELDGAHVTEVQAKADSQGVGWVVYLTLDDQGSKAFATLTADLVKRKDPNNMLAIVVKDQVVSAPVVNDVISGGQVQIAGNFTSESAKKLAADITG